MQITPSTLEAVFYAFRRDFQQGYTVAKPWYEALAMTTPSTTGEERHAWIDLIPRMRKWVGERAVLNLAARSYLLANEDFELTLAVKRNDILDDRIGLFSPMFQMMGRSTSKWPDDLVRAALQAGKTQLCFDGQFFFDTDHPVDMDDPTKGTYSNLLTGKALSATTYQEARQAIMTFKGADGLPMGIIPNTLAVPPQLEHVGRQILNADFIAPAAGFGGNGSDMQSNVLKGSANLVVIPELANEPAAWYLAATDMPVKPLVFQQRQAPVFVPKDQPSSSNVFSRKEFIYGVDSRGAAGYALPFLIVRGEG